MTKRVDPAIKRAFASRLQELMTAQGLTQGALAKKVYGKAQARANISNYLRGAFLPGPETVIKLAAALGVHVKELTAPPPPGRIPKTVPDPAPRPAPVPEPEPPVPNAVKVFGRRLSDVEVEAFAQRLRDLLAIRNLNRSAFGLKVYKDTRHNAAIALYTSGRAVPSPETLRLFAHALGVRVATLTTEPLTEPLPWDLPLDPEPLLPGDDPRKGPQEPAGAAARVVTNAEVVGLGNRFPSVVRLSPEQIEAVRGWFFVRYQWELDDIDAEMIQTGDFTAAVRKLRALRGKV